MNEPIRIDATTCTHCETCVRVCPTGHLAGGAAGVPAGGQKPCVLCGHCVAACPVGAVDIPGLADSTLRPAMPLPDVAAVDRLLMGKRSMRHFTDRPVPRELVEELIEVARLAPSAKNRQDRVYLVTCDVDRIAAMDRAVGECFAKLLRIMNPVTRACLGFLPVVRELNKAVPSLRRLVRRCRAGEQPVFHHAPCVVAIAGRKGNLLARDDCAVAEQNLMLAAHARGIGSCIIGYASTRPKSIAGQWDIPAGFAIEAVLALGYPAVSFPWIPPRKPVQVVWA